MNTPATCTLLVKAVDTSGDVATTTVANMEASAAEQERHVTILHITAEGLQLDLCFRRGEFSQMLAHPNDAAHETEVAVNFEEDA